MDRITLKRTDLQVSQIALGAADYGTKYDDAVAFSQMDTFFAAGGNLIDTAHVYGSWVAGMGNVSERVIGSWMKERKNRSRVVISTKGAHPALEDMDKSRVYPSEIVKDMEESLKGLQTDYIDLYFLHRDNPDVPAAELLGCLEEQVEKGNIRYYGCSNWHLPRMVEAQKAAEKEGFRGFVCNQVMYSLATADKNKLWDPTLVMMDRETYENHLQADWNVMAYMALAKGYLVKKVHGVEVTSGTASAYETEANRRLISYLKDLQQEGYAVDEVCLAYLMNQELLTVPVISFSKTAQLQAALRSCDLRMQREIMEKLEQLRREE
ncbi:MAG: aldo/keto reductase [Lachnospiraceae bacterium]|nr:aldo/keto reductase [Lachnospiraceae bacterium]